MEPLEYGLEALARYEKAARAYYAAQLRANGVPADEMIATIKAVVSRGLVRVGWRHGGALVLEILDWSLEGYYGSVSAERIAAPEPVRCAM